MRGAGSSRSGRAPAGQRATRQLEATQRALAGSRSHPTAWDVFRTVRDELPQVSLATVYRNLQKLAADGRVRPVPALDGPTRFDGRTAPHDHFVCRGCGVVIDVEPPRATLFTLRRRVGGHRVDDLAVTYFGLCRQCESGDGVAPGEG
jgi:Fe2+ or Zn2+ uptake regulation protein